MNNRSIICFLFILPILASAEMQYSYKGYFDIGTIHRLSDGSIIKIPYRMATLDYTILDNNFYVISSMALEFRLKDIDDIFGSDLTFDLRELYLEWITSFGNMSLGKQIITWGSASGNNPTDNISPYNYYYMSSMGKDRKEGIFSFNSNLYLGDIKLNAIFIPEHNTNILPLNDSEFTISTPIVPTDEQIMDLNKPFEYGISINIPFYSMDITTSHFSGYDRIVSFFGANVWSNLAFTKIIADTVLSYRKTDVSGLGFSVLLEDFTFRADLGYFNTDDNIKDNNDLFRDYESGKKSIIDACEEINAGLPSWAEKIVCANEPILKEILKLNNSAEYYQYTLEIEYTPTSDFNIIGQYSKQQSIKFGLADSLTLQDETILLDPEKLFIPGIGSPNTLISTNSLSISAQKSFSDRGFEVRYTSMFDLDKKGSLHEVGIEYEIYENTKILIAVNKILDNKNIQMNPFSGMEDFSHIRLGLKYYY